MFYKKLILPLVIGMVLSACSPIFPLFKKKKSPIPIIASLEKVDTVQKSVTRLKPYKEIVTLNAKTFKGMITVHRIEDKVMFEIPDSVLNQDMLIVCRISKAAAFNRVSNGMLGYAGDEVGKSLIRFIRGPGDKLFIKRLMFFERSSDSSANGMYRALKNSSLEPLVAAFDIKTVNKESNSVVIDMTDYLKGDNDVFFFGSLSKTLFQLGAIQADRSYISGLQSFPINLEIKTVKTYSSGSKSWTYELNSSIVLLPKKLMKARLSDPRVGYFAVGFQDFDKYSQKVGTTGFINKWRLEPRKEDIEKYKRGELVEPAKPIVYYIDPATPKKWVKYLIQGVNDWQKAFEKAGFKNAIFALEAPTDDASWSLEDLRHNVIVYKASAFLNASGPHVDDPRTGEILETHVNWYHGIMELLHRWYMIQAGPNDPRAQKPAFDDELMGQLIRFVCSHEVGHTLGLAHNLMASSSIPVEKLRDKAWVEENGFCPSIMDYARFNYVAQPEDHISERGLFPRIGVYDEWAIEWGYRPQPEFQNRDEEKIFNNRLIIDRLSKDKRLLFCFELLTGPKVQAEDLGDNVMKANAYGIENLKRVASNLMKWTTQPGEEYGDASAMYSELVNQYQRYLDHVLNQIGGIDFIPKTTDQPGPLNSFPSKAKQREAVQFLQDQLFKTPTWILNEQVFSRMRWQQDGTGTSLQVLGIQQKLLASLMSLGRLNMMSQNKNLYFDKAYSPVEMLVDLRKGIWAELHLKKPIDMYRRNLQKVYVLQLGSLIVPKGNIFDDKNTAVSIYRFSAKTDQLSMLKEQAKILLADINHALPDYKDHASITHLNAVKELLLLALNGRSVGNAGSVMDTPSAADNSFSPLVTPAIGPTSPISMDTPLNCWDVKVW